MRHDGASCPRDGHGGGGISSVVDGLQYLSRRLGSARAISCSTSGRAPARLPNPSLPVALMSSRCSSTRGVRRRTAAEVRARPRHRGHRRRSRPSGCHDARSWRRCQPAVRHLRVALLRRLVAPGSRLVRADVVLPWHVAKRWTSRAAPGNGRWLSAANRRGRATAPPLRPFTATTERRRRARHRAATTSNHQVELRTARKCRKCRPGVLN